MLYAVDLFCGAGGASTGLVRACDAVGVKLNLLAINHWPTAVQTHLLNHPNVRHMCEAVERIDPRKEVPGGRLHLLLAGPECTHFSTARGGRPVNPQSRASAWHILKWAQELYIDTILIENVPEFRTWGPIGADQRPMKSRKGETYRAFLAALRSLGYKVEDKILNAADYGDPTTRQRLFIMARRGKHVIHWPEATHSKTGGATLFGGRKKWKAAREIIDWSLEGKSIFNRKKPLRPATIARILAGLEKFGGPELKPFLVVLRNNQAGQSIDGPVPALTAGGEHVGVAQPFVMPVNHGAEELRSRSTEEPLPTLTARANQYLVEPMVLSQQSGSVARPVDQPVPTVATDGAIGLAEPFLVPYNGTAAEARVHSVDVPLRTQTTENRFGVAEPFLVPFYGERDGQSPRTHSVDEPVPVIPGSGDGKFAVVAPFLSTYYGNAGMVPITDPVPTVTTKDRVALAEPFIVPNNTNNVAKSVDDPMSTITGGYRLALVQPVINGLALDIRFRMLQPHELAAAMSFPKEYKFTGKREEVVKQIGNAWPGELALALCKAIAIDYAPKKRVRKEAAA